MANFQATNSNPYNPFNPTKRDLQRTSELSKKSPVAAGLLTFLFWPAGLIYMGRGINFLKIIGYIFLTGFAIGFVAGASGSDTSDDLTNGVSNAAGFVGGVVLAAEQVNCIKKAKERDQA